MSKLVDIKADSSLDISVESQLLENMQKSYTWFTSKKFSFVAIPAFAAIDIIGFKQITNVTIETSRIQQIIIIAALAVAFELAPLYIGYALCLKCYKLGRPIHNWILSFASVACFMGIIGNVVFRVWTMDIVYWNRIEKARDKLALPITILMCLLPIITSLINLTIGCLTFDPLIFDMMRLSKKLHKLKVKKRQIKAYLKELESDDKLKDELEKDEENRYNKMIEEITVLRNKLQSYIITRVFTV